MDNVTLYKFDIFDTDDHSYTGKVEFLYVVEEDGTVKTALEVNGKAIKIPTNLADNLIGVLEGEYIAKPNK